MKFITMELGTASAFYWVPALFSEEAAAELPDGGDAGGIEADLFKESDRLLLYRYC